MTIVLTREICILQYIAIIKPSILSNTLMSFTSYPTNDALQVAVLKNISELILQKT